MWIEAPEIASFAQPGQFITVRCEDLILRRPFSIHQALTLSSPLMGEDCRHGFLNPCKSEIALLFKVVGQGTFWLSKLQRGDKIDVLGPLGTGFSIPSVIARHEVPKQSRNLLLVAGGIGIAPLIFFAQQVSSRHSITLIHGAIAAAQLYKQSLPSEVRFIPVTEDGSAGKKGMATDIVPDFLDWADQVYACGPIDMYKALARLSLRAKRSNLKLKKCQVSLEVRMGCGIGACYGCTINTRKGLKRVCRDGPVFELDDILWEEVKL
jgi:dihydroorotate dehydrogenase electron transfer subunit